MSIEVKQFDGSSVTPKDDALVYDLIFNSYGVFNGCGISFLGVNQLRVASGRMIVKGRQVVITEETVAAQLSASGAKKGRLYIHIDLSNQTTPAQFMTQVEDVLPNLVQEDDVNYNDGIFEIELCTYDVSETAISNIVETCPIITGGVDLLKSMEEVLANTKPGKAVDALVVKELTDSLGGLQFGIDENGNYGYIKAGADSVTPFSGFDLLWEDTGSGDISDIELDLSAYSYVLLRCKYARSSEYFLDFLVEVGSSGTIITPAGIGGSNNQSVINRTFTVSITGITFTSASSTNKTRCLPIMIYGIK